MKRIIQNHKSDFSLSIDDYKNDFLPKEKAIELINFLETGIENNFKLSFYGERDYEGCFQGIEFDFYEVIEETEEEYQERIKEEQLSSKIVKERIEYKLYLQLKEKYESRNRK